MKQTQSSETDPLRRYLLGESSADERSTVERRLMSDQPYLDELARAEEELIDEYARGNLDAQEKEKFESLFLNVPERREKIIFAQAFNRYLARHPVARSEKGHEHIPPSFWRRAAVGLMAAVVLLALASAFLYWKSTQVREQLAKSELERAASEKTGQLISNQLNDEQRRNQELEQELAALRSEARPAASDVVTLALTSGWSRGADGTATATLSSSTKRLRLDMSVSQDLPGYSSYQAQVQTVEGKGVWSKDRLQLAQKNGKRFVSVTVPVSAIPAGDYLAVLTGFAADGTAQQIGSYYFRAVRKSSS